MESPERLLKKIEATKLTDIEFKVMVIRMLKELREKFKESRETSTNLLRNTPA